MIITITNPDGSIVCPVLIDNPAYDEYIDKPRRLTAKIEKHSGLNPQGTARADHEGKIILLGHIKSFDQSKKDYDTLTLDSAEALLDERIGQFYRYPAGTALNEMLASSMGGDVVGLLAMANGLIPRGSFVLHSGHVYKWTGMGTASRLGTVASLYQGATLLTKDTAIPSSAGRWWQDASDLYVWCSDSRDPAYHLMIIPNFKDTLLRLGTISTGSTTFAVCYEIGAGKLSSPIKSLILAGGLEHAVRYEKDGYAYLDASAAVGLGSETEPVATYIDGQNAEISAEEIDGIGKVQALLGQGAGSGMTQQCAAAFDPTTAGTWREATYSGAGLFGAMLRAATEKVFSDYNDGTVYNVRSIDTDWSQAVGNYVRLIIDGHQPVNRRIKHVQMKGSGQMILEVGQRLRTLAELLKAGDEVQDALSSFYGSHTKNAWSWSLPETNIDSYAPISHSFLLASTDDSTKGSDDETIGSGEIDPNFPFQVLLSLSLGWFTSDTYNAIVASNSHSNVGSHSGYGGTETSEETQEKHSVNQQSTTGPSSGLFNFNAYAGDSYYTGYASEPGHTYSNTSASRTTGTASGHTHSYNDYYCSGVWATGTHRHAYTVMTTYLNAVNATHTHPVSTHNTNDAEDQSHTTASQSAKTRAGSTAHPETNAALEGWKKEYATGNSIHYLTLTVKVNGVAVPGSPFTGDGGTGLYIGDNLNNIDISDLCVVGQKNEIEITVSEYGGSDPVRCSISGNVNVNAVISAF